MAKGRCPALFIWVVSFDACMTIAMSVYTVCAKVERTWFGVRSPCGNER